MPSSRLLSAALESTSKKPEGASQVSDPKHSLPTVQGLSEAGAARPRVNRLSAGHIPGGREYGGTGVLLTLMSFKLRLSTWAPSASLLLSSSTAPAVPQVPTLLQRLRHGGKGRRLAAPKRVLPVPQPGTEPGQPRTWATPSLRGLLFHPHCPRPHSPPLRAQKRREAAPARSRSPR